MQASDTEGIGSVQNSFIDGDEQLGELYLVATPIGNLGDMTSRAISILKEVDLIAAEDTRQTRKLLQVFDIPTKMTSYHEHNKGHKGEYILQQLQAGKNVALVSDAGLPGVSDPGSDIASLAIRANFKVIPIPGASASLTSLIASGIDTDRFLFYGFLDRHRSKRTKELQQLKGLPFTLLFYESPHRIKETLQDLISVLGDRQASIGRELTKKYEQFIRGPLSFCQEIITSNKIQGEFTIVVTGASIEEQEAELLVAQWWTGLSIEEHVNKYIEQGEASGNAIKLAAKDRGVQKRAIYQQYHNIKEP
jgi:16S rRNA (cytidine1402-2'-O)-methyltransferase